MIDNEGVDLVLISEISKIILYVIFNFTFVTARVNDIKVTFPMFYLITLSRPLTLACSVLFLFYLFSFYLLFNTKKNLAMCTALC